MGCMTSSAGFSGGALGSGPASASSALSGRMGPSVMGRKASLTCSQPGAAPIRMRGLPATTVPSTSQSVS
ncbi:hypothetical protein D3C72_1029370 [compost metagenome]